MKDKILTRMGDGERVTMPADEVKEELLLGTQDAAQKGEIPELTRDDLDQMFEILAESGRIVSVPPGDEVVVTDDGCAKPDLLYDVAIHHRAVFLWRATQSWTLFSQGRAAPESGRPFADGQN
jgi:hypothetical protein